MARCLAASLLLLSLLHFHSPPAHAGPIADVPFKQSNIGDSISQGNGADGNIGDKVSLSWVQGTSEEIRSAYLRFRDVKPDFAQQPESVSGAELVGGDDNFAAQAQRVCQQEVKPNYVWVLMGGNDVCNRPRSSTSDAAANLYSVGTWTNALRAGLDQLAACLPSSATVHVLSVPRVDFLYAAGHKKGFWCTGILWPIAGVCRIVTAEKKQERRDQIGARINQYNEAIFAEMVAYDSNANGKNPGRVHFRTDWIGSIEEQHLNTSIGTYAFQSSEINGFDCFHPNREGQRKIACTGWATNPYGEGSVPACLDAAAAKGVTP